MTNARFDVKAFVISRLFAHSSARRRRAREQVLQRPPEIPLLRSSSVDSVAPFVSVSALSVTSYLHPTRAASRCSNVGLYSAAETSSSRSRHSRIDGMIATPSFLEAVLA
jgi:hypothetical protein